MPRKGSATAQRIQPEQHNLLDYVEIKSEFRHTNEYLDGDDTNSYLFPSEDTELQDELNVLAKKLVALSQTQAFARVNQYDRARPFIEAAREFLEGPPLMPKGMSEEEYAFAVEVGRAVKERWPKGGIGRGYRPAHFIDDHFGKDRGFLNNPLFCLATLSVIDPDLYNAYLSSIRPDRLKRNPTDDLRLRGQGTRTAKTGGKRLPVAALTINSEQDVLNNLSADEREQLRALRAERSRVSAGKRVRNQSVR